MFGLTIETCRANLRDTEHSHAWDVKLVGQGKSMVIQFSMGKAHREYRKFRNMNEGGPSVVRVTRPTHQYQDQKESFERHHKPATPTLADVLPCLQSDLRAAEGSFENFCSEFGYDSDSISALKVYNKCCEYDKQLRGLMSGAEFHRFMEHDFDGDGK